MTPQEQQAAKKTSALIRAARKRVGYTQTDVANRLGISQSALSKLENGILIPSAPQWFEFCDMTGISPDSLTIGFLERNRPATLENGPSDSGFRIPRAFAVDRGSKVRAVLPFLHHFRTALGENRLNDYLDFIRMDRDFFVDLDNQVGLKLSLDLSRQMVNQGVLKTKDISKMTKFVAQPDAHGRMRSFYDGSQTTLNRLQVLLAHSRHYECNFKYVIEDQKKNSIVLSVLPEKHMKDTGYRGDPTLGDFVCKYKQNYFEKFATYGGGPGVEFHERECHYHGAEKCVYEFKAAA